LAGQQNPPTPPGGTPAAAAPAAAPKPAEAQPAPAETKPTAESPKGTDPARMAAPKAADQKKPGGPVDDHSYILGAEDNISVVVASSPEITGTGTHLIRPDGRITIPLIGEVMAAGLTPEQLADMVREKAKKYVVDPDVTVAVLGVGSKRYFINGEVNKTGEYKLFVPTKVLEALVNAGGFREFAKTSDIVIIREENGATKRMHFNYKDVIKGKHLEQNVFLKPGDIIVVR